eukprot:9848545-Alexandrium_andersonii.AAC.1
MSATASRRRRVEVNERRLSPSEAEAVHCAKGLEFASWLRNEVLDLAVQRGIDRRRCMRSRW